MQETEDIKTTKENDTVAEDTTETVNIEDVKEELSSIAKSAKKIAQTTAKVGAKKTKEVVEKVKVESGKTTDELKEDSKEVLEKVKKEAKKTSKKIADLFKNTAIHTFIQVNQIEIDEDTIIEKVKESHYAKSDEKVKSLNLYIKPEENKAYYVINGTELGEVIINE